MQAETHLSIRYAKYVSYGAIIGTRRDDVVIERIPLDVQNGTGMSSYSAGVEVETAGLQH